MNTRFDERTVQLALIASLLIGFLTISGSAQAADAAMNADQIKQLIIGNTISGSVGGSRYSIYYQANAKVSGVFHGSGMLADDDDGTWKIKDADKLCQEFSDTFNGEEHCYQWHKADGQRYLMRNVDSFRIDDLEVWKIEKGNPLGM
jgi:hypothetical protein